MEFNKVVVIEVELRKKTWFHCISFFTICLYVHMYVLCTSIYSNGYILSGFYYLWYKDIHDGIDLLMGNSLNICQPHMPQTQKKQQKGKYPFQVDLLCSSPWHFNMLIAVSVLSHMWLFSPVLPSLPV